MTPRWFLLAGVLSVASAPAPAQQAQLDQAQAAANARPGPRTLPARVVPVPTNLDPATAALVAAPYSPFWNIDPPNDAAWRALLAKAATGALPGLAKARAALGVTIAPTTVGGVKAFMLTPMQFTPAHRRPRRELSAAAWAR